jgi:hypothetical protein
MSTFDPLTEATERRRRLFGEAAAERLARRPTTRRALAAALRRAADRLDPAAPRIALTPHRMN